MLQLSSSCMLVPWWLELSLTHILALHVMRLYWDPIAFRRKTNIIRKSHRMSVYHWMDIRYKASLLADFGHKRASFLPGHAVPATEMVQASGWTWDLQDTAVWPCCGHAHDLSFAIIYNFNFKRTYIYIYIMYIPRPCQVPTTMGWHTDSYVILRLLAKFLWGLGGSKYPSVSPMATGGLPELQEGWRSRPASLWRGASANFPGCCC